MKEKYVIICSTSSGCIFLRNGDTRKKTCQWTSLLDDALLFEYYWDAAGAVVQVGLRDAEEITIKEVSKWLAG